MKLRLLSLYFTTVLLLVFAVSPTFSRAQQIASSSDVLVSLSPENPAPGENVSIALSSYAYNLNSVLITWSVNGKSSGSGIGKKSFSVNAPKAGAETNVIATLSLPDGTVSTRIIIRPAVMVLLWQANDSYVPPFYKGKAMPTPDSQIKVVAMPEVKTGNGTFVDPQKMLYAWQQDYTNDQEASGYGKNSFTYATDYLESSNNISVTAATIDQKYSSNASINIGMVEPKIVFYKNDLNLGTIWQLALTDGHTIMSDEIIQAAPYFISPKEILTPTLSWSWSINDSPISVADYRKYLIPLKVQPGVSGTSKIGLQIRNSYKLFENASKELTVQF